MIVLGVLFGPTALFMETSPAVDPLALLAGGFGDAALRGAAGIRLRPKHLHTVGPRQMAVPCMSCRHDA